MNAVSVHMSEGAAGAVEPVLVGTLRGSFQGGRRLVSTSFEYAQSYLQRAGAYELSPDLPLRSGRVYTGADATMFGAIADATPDDWGTSLIDAQWAIERTKDQPAFLGEFDHLVQLNDATRVGALRFAEVGKTEFLTLDGRTSVRLADAQRLAEAASRFEKYEASDEDVELLGWAGSSLGGARPKATIMEGGALWLLKLPSNRDRRTDIEAWEAVALELAERAGLRVPRRRLIPIEDLNSSLLVERFDRAHAPGQVRTEQTELTEGAESAGSQIRVGYQSALSAMAVGSVQDRRTYEDFADTIDMMTGSRDELKEMFGRVALNVLIGNVDDHWRNHGFVREGDRWRLSPVFDVNPTRAGSKVQARQISPMDDPYDRDVRILIEGRDAYGLTEMQAAEGIARVAAAVEQWGDVAKELSITEAEIESMESAFSQAQLEHAKAFSDAHA
jgi:serine/threonine-protein kinase HipA